MSLRAGDLFANRFAIDHTAGVGGMGAVYRAKDLLSGEFVALKLLLELKVGGDEVERFSREAQLLAELHHSGIVSYVAHGVSPNGQPFLAMQWLDGENLAQRLERGPLSVRDAIVPAKHVADALAFAHARGIIHRDTTRKNKICSLAGHKATHRRRTDHAHALHAHSPH